MDLSRFPRRRYTHAPTPIELLPHFTKALAASCPGGVGPEISVRALAEMSAEDRAATRIYGNLATLNAARDALGLSIDLVPYVVDVEVEGAPLPWGTLSPVAGDAAFRFIEKAVRDAEAGTIGCIVTAPINKEALNLAGHHYDGHTGMLAALTDAKSAFMLLAGLAPYLFFKRKGWL